MTTYWSKIAEKPTPPSFGTFLWGDPLQIVRRLIPCQKLESWGYQMVCISRSCFRSASPRVRWADRHATDTTYHQQTTNQPASQSDSTLLKAGKNVSAARCSLRKLKSPALCQSLRQLGEPISHLVLLFLLQCCTLNYASRRKLFLVTYVKGSYAFTSVCRSVR